MLLCSHAIFDILPQFHSGTRDIVVISSATDLLDFMLFLYACFMFFICHSTLGVYPYLGLLLVFGLET